MRYLVKKNFMGLDKNGKKAMVQKGTFVEEKQIPNFEDKLESGMLVGESEVSAEELEQLEKKIQTAKAELASLEADLAERKKDLPLAPPVSSEASFNPNGDESTADDDLGDLDLGDDDDHEEVEVDGETPEAPKKKVKVKKKKARS